MNLCVHELLLVTMIEDQIISNVTCDVGKQTKISSFLKSEEMSTKPWGKFHSLFQSPSLPSRSLLFTLFLFSPFTFSLILLSSFHAFCSDISLEWSLRTQYLRVVYMWCEHFFSDGLLCPISIVFFLFFFFFIPLPSFFSI